MLTLALDRFTHRGQACAVDRYFCFRFDVDTHRCIRRGVPNLLELGARLDAPFTFFVNMGRAVSLTRAIRSRLTGEGQGAETAAKLPARSKLGPWDTLVAAALNPLVGAGAPDILRQVAADGHEIGLHGGSNHALWQALAHRWPEGRLRGEITGALKRLESVTGRQPAGFASPGWNSPAGLAPILAELGFSYVADVHDPAAPAITYAADAPQLASVRTNLTAEPGGVAFLENMAARGLDAEDMRDAFVRRLQDTEQLAVVYDHPYFAGIQALDSVADLIAAARELGFRIATLKETVEALAPGAGR